MKKTLAILLSALMLCTVIGCDRYKEDTSESSATQTAAPVEMTEKPDGTTAADEKTPAEDKEISVYTEQYMQGECSVTLMYPRFGDTNHDAFDLSVRNFAVHKFTGCGLLPEDSAVYEVTSCEIKYVSEHFVSAVAIGQIINPMAAHDTHFSYTVNADPKTGKIYLSEELIGDVELIRSAIAREEFTQSYGIDGLMNEITPDVITQSWRSDYGVFPEMYFTKDSFGIVAELPHAVGGYAGFEIPYAETGEMINPVAKGLCGIIVTTD